MSRIGKAPVTLPKGVELTVGENNVIRVKGPKGELFQKVDVDINIEVKDGEVVLTRPTEQKRHKALHGLYRSLVANMVEGVANGYKKELELVGVGYKATATGQNLELNIGFSHPIIIQFPKEIKVSAEMLKGSNPKVFLETIDKQLLGQVAAKVRSLRKPEPYKGKGIKYSNEFIRRKAGKSASK